MKEQKSIQTDQDLFDAIDEMYKNTPPPEGLEESRLYIESTGNDPSVSKRISQLIERKLLWQVVDPNVLEERRQALSSSPLITDRTNEELRNLIDLVLNKVKGKGFKPGLAFYRNQKNLSKEDLAGLLQELVFFAKRSGIDLEFDE